MAPPIVVVVVVSDGSRWATWSRGGGDTRRRRKAPQECGANAHIYDHLAFASRPRRLGFSSAHWAALNVNAAWLKCCGEISAIRLESASHENCTFGLPHHLQIVHIFTKLYSNIFLGLDQLITTISLYKMHIHMYKIEENLKSHKNINTWKMFRNRILSAQAPNTRPAPEILSHLANCTCKNNFAWPVYFRSPLLQSPAHCN